MGYAAFAQFATRSLRNTKCVVGLCSRNCATIAGVAQLVEQRIRNAKVGCSIHLTGTNRAHTSDWVKNEPANVATPYRASSKTIGGDRIASYPLCSPIR